MAEKLDSIVILDFGSQYTRLIARKIRELGVYSEIIPFNTPFKKIIELNPKGIILSGGPSSVYSDTSPRLDEKVFSIRVPVLGICYGLQLIAQVFGGKVCSSKDREYGKTELQILDNSTLFKGFNPNHNIVVWMSHSDSVLEIPKGFKKIAETKNSPFAAIACESKKIYGVQFHPEVVHTERGKEVLKNFTREVCGLSKSWNVSSFIEREVKYIRDLVKDNKVICALSGGVDSSVVATLLGNAIGDNAKVVFINNGLLRKNEENEVLDNFRKGFGFDLIYIDAKERFLKKLKGVTDPERKRKIIGKEFINIFEQKAKELGGIKFLAQGTLYPDIIESVSFKGPSATIKSHHNVGGLPKKMELILIEPLKELFKDEVRKLGRILGVPENILKRHPFPGPGLAIRIIGKITEDRLNTLKEADSIIIEEIKKADLYDKIWQAFSVLLPIKSVGVMGDKRTYENVLVLRAVQSVDGMTADWYKIPYDVLEKISSRVINEIKGVNRVVYDISSKPPSTIEWE